MSTRTGFDTDERKSRFSIGYLKVPLIFRWFAVKGAKLISVRLTCRGGVFSLNSEKTTVSILAVISVHWNEKV